jgi:two-component system sensor histidine kinase PilS (NtrC family)
MISNEQVFSLEPRVTFWRSLQTLNITRIVISLVLLAYLGWGTNKGFQLQAQPFFLQISVTYLLLALLFILLAVYCRRRFLLQLSSQIGIDIAVISLLYVISGGAKSGLSILYLFPLAGAAILAPLVLALFFVSLVALFLLGESGYQVLRFESDTSIMQAGLYGAAFFVVIFVVNRLAAKLIRQEDLARQRGQDLQIQQAINRLIIADMGDGILVVNRDGTMLMGNPAAEQMLGLASTYGRPDCRLADIASLAPITDAFFTWSEQLSSQHPVDDAAIFVFIKPGADQTLSAATTIWGGRRELASHLKCRFATVDTVGLAEDRYIIFLRDVTEIENQAQQLKLASMGRLTASIAHEVRNPLSAIAHAAALLEEDVVSPSELRLLKIVSDNAARVNRMIEDILNLSRKAQLHGEPLFLRQVLADILAEFGETHALPEGIFKLTGVDVHQVQFDPVHLREVVVNLLTNAVRYASGTNGSIRLHVVSDAANRLELHVQDDGPGISPEVRAHLFEPFYTTSSKGTGLGLYLARELCLNNGAILDYEYRVESAYDGLDQTAGRFVITFALSDPL